MRERQQWVVWKRESRNGKPTKVPYDPHAGRRARTNDPSTWTGLDDALASLVDSKWRGVGFVFTVNDGLVGVDLDGCRDPRTGGVHQTAWDLVAELDSYTEVSPSGCGLHVIARGSVPPLVAGTGGRTSDVPWRDERADAALEIYYSGRYFTVTGCQVLLP